MAKPDYEKLLGGYATGTLSEAECHALFEAALHDQALFDALADEQALKEFLDDPENRRRLLATLEAFEGTQEKPSRWGALVPAWLPLPATAPSLPPKARSWRGVLAGGLILGALAVIVAAGLIEEMMSPPQPVLTADVRRMEEAAPPAAPPALEMPPTLSQGRQSEHDNPPSAVLEDQVARKAMPARPLRDRQTRPLASGLERERASQQTQPSPPLASTATTPAPEEQTEPKLERLPEPSTAPSPAGSGTVAVEAPPPVVSARALFYAGAGSLDPGREGSAQGRSMEETREESRQFATLRAERAEGSGPASPLPNLSRTIQSSGRLLGVRYSLVKQTASGTDQEVSATTMFNADDETRLTIEVNMAGYLYVLKRTLPEVWTVLYPNLGAAADPAGRAAYVHSGTRYVIPSAGSLIKAGEHGPAQLVILFARDPEPALGSLGTELPERDPAQWRRISDLIRRIRTEVAGGKFLTERAEPGTAGMQAEHAVYVVDRSTVPVSRLLADVMLSFR